MNKERFIKRIRLIQNFMSEQDTLQALIEKITNGHSVVDIGSYLITEMISMIVEMMDIKDEDFLFWWFFEDVDKVLYDGDKEISVRTVEELYDYLVEDKQ